MKKKRFWKNAGLVALSGVLVGGAALAFTACGDGGGGTPTRTDYTLSVFIFCGQADAMTNRTICENWAREYSEAHAAELGGNTITVDFTSNSSDTEYYNQLDGYIRQNSLPDIIYLAPSAVLTHAGSRRLLDLSSYLTASQEIVDQVNSIWTDSLGFYATVGNSLTMRRAGGIEYDAATNTFVDPTTENRAKVGIYGLPKDYSNFGLGYNRNYFTDEFKAAYTTLKPSSGAGTRSVKTRLYRNGNLVESGTNTTTNGTVTAPTHTGADTMSITYAVDVENYTNPYTKETVKANKGTPAAFINIGIPTVYKPFNFYKYATYTDALRAGDPLATSTQAFTGGQGYTVTVPGFPGETFELTNSDGSEKYENSINEHAEYDKETGNIVLTWAEYGALNWACAYMLNSFAWDSVDGMKSTDNSYAAWMTGQGGVYTGAGGSASDTQETGDFNNVYGGEQYEQGNGGNLYVLPWLFSNDATYINADYTKVLNDAKDGTTIATRDGNTWNWSAGKDNDVHSRVGNAYDIVEKINLDGTTRNAMVQYGVNSENFVETYGAFQEYIATWNAHCGQTGDVVTSSSDKGTLNGQSFFVMGASLFYGVGSWDVSEYQEVNQDILSVGVMPTAVSNKLSLYAQGRSAYYVDGNRNALVNTYSNGATTKGTGENAGTATAGGVAGDYAQRENLEAGKVIYTQEQIWQNQVLRQDKWAGRMDSVGYAVNANVAAENQPAWLAAAATDLVMELTIGEQSQITLTYGGAQIPNVREQCTEYLRYQDDGYENGAFKDMITPEGDADGNDVWEQYYAVATEMARASQNNDETRTVAEFLNGRKITIDGQETDIKYDTQYANVRLVDFTTATVSTTGIAYAMRVLRMINYTRAERDILIRMQTGMNSVRDQTLYTASTGWISNFDATASPNQFLAYINQAALSKEQRNLLQVTAFNVSEISGDLGNGVTRSFMTPAVYCVNSALSVQNSLTSGT